MKNPCLTCVLLTEDKNGPECMYCERRLNYVAALGGMGHGVPDHLCNFTKGENMGVESHSGVKKLDSSKMRKCTGCKLELELNEGNFNHHPKARDGWSKLCRTCFSKSLARGRKRAKAQKIAEKKARKKAKAEKKQPGARMDPEPIREAPAADPEGPQDEFLVVHFKHSPDPELFKKLKELCALEFRSLENQVFHLIRCAWDQAKRQEKPAWLRDYFVK